MIVKRGELMGMDFQVCARQPGAGALAAARGITAMRHHRAAASLRRRAPGFPGRPRRQASAAHCWPVAGGLAGFTLHATGRHLAAQAEIDALKNVDWDAELARVQDPSVKYPGWYWRDAPAHGGHAMHMPPRPAGPPTDGPSCQPSLCCCSLLHRAIPRVPRGQPGVVSMPPCRPVGCLSAARGRGGAYAVLRRGGGANERRNDHAAPNPTALSWRLFLLLHAPWPGCRGPAMEMTVAARSVHSTVYDPEGKTVDPQVKPGARAAWKSRSDCSRQGAATACLPRSCCGCCGGPRGHGGACCPAPTS